jgi:hypothetical protein
MSVDNEQVRMVGELLSHALFYRQMSEDCINRAKALEETAQRMLGHPDVVEKPWKDLSPCQ